MKLSVKSDYAARAVLGLARHYASGSAVRVEDLASEQNLPANYLVQILLELKAAGIARSVRGKEGGYRLARPTRRITVREALDVLGGRFFGPGFCENHAGVRRECVHSTDCAIRPLLAAVQSVLDGVFGKMTLADLLCSEREASARVTYRIANNLL